MHLPVDREIVSMGGTRVRVTSARTFDAVREALSAQMGRVTVPEVTALARQVETPEEYHRIVSERWVGTSGFMQFAVIDHGEWLPLYGIERRTERWILGNPLIAITMIRHDISAGLFAPVELLITEGAEGAGCTIDYVIPSSMIAPAGSSDDLRRTARALDEKLDALIASAAGTG